MIVFAYQANLQLPGNASVGQWTPDPLLGGTSGATAISFTGPTAGEVGVPTSVFTAEPNGIYTGVGNLSDDGAGGSFSPPSLSWSASAAAQMATYTAAESGTIPISISVSPVLTISGSPIELIVTSSTAIGLPLDAWSAVLVG
jgi:hypothetical protein